MNTSSTKEAPYLEDVTSSAQYKFSTANSQYVASNDRITYFDSFNKVGEKIYRTDWTGREFFAAKGSTDIAEYQENRKLRYSLFLSQKHEYDCASNAYGVHETILKALRAGEVQAYYLNHYTGEETTLEPSFWKSQKASFTIDRGCYKAPDRNKRPAVPGVDFIVALDLKGFEQVLKAMPKHLKVEKQSPKAELVGKARANIIAACKENGAILNRQIYKSALNYMLNTDYFTDDNVKSCWKNEIPISLKNTKRASSVKYLSLEVLSKRPFS